MILYQGSTHQGLLTVRIIYNYSNNYYFQKGNNETEVDVVISETLVQVYETINAFLPSRCLLGILHVFCLRHDL